MKKMVQEESKLQPQDASPEEKRKARRTVALQLERGIPAPEAYLLLDMLGLLEEA